MKEKAEVIPHKPKIIVQYCYCKKCQKHYENPKLTKEVQRGSPMCGMQNGDV